MEVSMIGSLPVLLSESAGAGHCPGRGRGGSETLPFAIMRVFDRAEALQLPVLTGWSGSIPASGKLEFGRPYLFDEVARAFPRRNWASRWRVL